MKSFKFLQGDVDFKSYGGVWYRELDKGQYHIVELLNFPEATGSKLEDKYTYSVSLGEIDLCYITDSTLERALKCCGHEKGLDCIDDLEKVRCLQSYGAVAPLSQSKGNNADKLVRDMIKLSKVLEKDEALHTERLMRPVNAIGSTAVEMMQGDFNSAMSRASGKSNSVGAVVKMKKVPSDDPLAFITGMLNGIAGGMLPYGVKRKELDPEYLRGFKEGSHIRADKAEWPDYMKKTEASPVLKPA